MSGYSVVPQGVKRDAEEFHHQADQLDVAMADLQGSPARLRAAVPGEFGAFLGDVAEKGVGAFGILTADVRAKGEAIAAMSSHAELDTAIAGEVKRA